ncbi:hypothetical protein CVD23_03420 [Bacillus sp. V33-4]|nr:hypothetical protein CVD23_03420 [Bacillus sp. V33-4]
MGKKTIAIGEHHFLILSKHKNVLKFLNQNFQQCNPQDNVERYMQIRIEGDYGIPFVGYKVEVIKSVDKICFRRADYQIETDLDHKTATVRVYNDLALKHALMNLYSSFILHHNWGLLIHSSCAIDKGEAHIFAGQSGAGKSTAARLSHPRDVLSDEATLVKITPDAVTVFNSPFRSEITANGPGESAPLASIQILYHALENNRVKLRKPDALIHLMDKVFYWAHSPEETNRILGLLRTMVGTVPSYELHFKKDQTFWELIS